MFDVSVSLKISMSHMGVLVNNQLNVVMINNCVTFKDENNKEQMPQVSMQSILDNYCEYFEDEPELLKTNLVELKMKLEQEVI